MNAHKSDSGRSLWSRARGLYSRKSASFVFRNSIVVRPAKPIISFSFDDFPRSALKTGGEILHRFGLAGTYYVSLGLQGKLEPSGEMFGAADLNAVFEGGHELGCHTFSHCHSWDTDPQRYEDAIIENRMTLRRRFPDADFQTFSYPICPPRPLTKARVARHFLCCRGGGQTFNTGPSDLNQLSSFFLEKSRNDLQRVKDLIDLNRDARGWLIFATHDISDSPTPYGCPPQFFEQIVRYAIGSGALIVPVVKALGSLRQEQLTQF